MNHILMKRSRYTKEKGSKKAKKKKKEQQKQELDRVVF
jgi:hypothetical protein